MIIYPAIDLRGGQVVRLKEGRTDQQTVFSSDPVATAARWIASGAEWLHVVNLDGAFADASDNLSVMSRIAELGIPVQFGGGLRTPGDIEKALQLGAARLVLGTAAVSDPQLVADAIIRFGPEAISVALDARNGRVATHGWQAISNITPTSLGKQMAEVGVRHALFTDVSRDGGLTGSNIEATDMLGRETGLQVIASGGVSGLDEIRAIARREHIAGAIIGMALYTGKFTLEDALKASKD
ncbi:MAG: 1-(5-phosphoribosyl)-5-[(5-phosphoribosylamino)methylideneamino]imidazole-4-carboxamide isomerase [Chloroflexi bacterium]|nr:1-(5-phosphoribosyl)-5-[(5-phosphoribosylamino)methylideneamino]imidazole-4-carboxamide isomerase [Chloroflexota bacterium]